MAKNTVIDLKKQIVNLTNANKELRKKVGGSAKSLEKLASDMSLADNNTRALAGSLKDKLNVSANIATKAVKKQQATIEATAKSKARLKTRIDVLIGRLKDEGIATQEVVNWQKLRKKAIDGNAVALDKLNRRTAQTIAAKRKERKAIDEATQSIHAQERSYKELFMVMRGGKIGDVQGGMFGARNLRNIHAGGAAFSVLRSKLLLASFAFGLVNRAIVRFVELAGKQQAAERKVEQAIISTKGAAGLGATELRNYARALQQVSTFGDEAILSSSALLLTFKEIKGDTFKEAQKMILDVSVAMGQDLKSSTIQLGKALNDPILGLGALSRVGIQFTKTQKIMIKNFVKTGDVAKAQGIILDELDSQFGGMSEAMLDTASGAIAQMKNAMGDLGEEIGENLSPLVLAFSNNIKEMAESGKLNLGIFKLSVDEVLKSLVALTIGFVAMPKMFSLVNAGFLAVSTGATAGAAALNVFKMAMIKTGVGIFAVGIGFLISKLTGLNDIIHKPAGLKDGLADIIASFKDMETIQKKVKKVELEAQIKELEKAYDKLGKAIANSNKKDALMISAFKGLEKKLKNLRLQAGALNELDEATIKNNESMAEALSLYNKSNEGKKEELQIHVDRLKIMAENNELDEDTRKGYELMIKLLDSYTQKITKALTIEEQVRLKELEVFNTIKEMKIAGYEELTSAALNFFQTMVEGSKKAELQDLDRHKAEIQNMNISEGAKTTLLDANEKKREAIEKKAHNRSLVLQQLQLAAQLAVTIAQIRLQTTIADEKAIATFGLIAAAPIIAANESFAALQTNLAIASAGVGIATLQAQRLAKGGDFITEGPQAIIVGDNPGGREHVQVTPLSSPNIEGPQGGGVVVNFTGNVISQDFIEDEAIPMIKEAIRRGADIGVA